MQPLLKKDLVAQQVEHIPFKDGVLGSSPSWITFFQNANTKFDELVAQQVEHIPFKDGVLGSSPSWLTSQSLPINFGRFLCFIYLNRPIINEPISALIILTQFFDKKYCNLSIEKRYFCSVFKVTKHRQLDLQAI